MTIARTVADVLSEHVSFEVECIDWMYLNVYQPTLQYAAGLVGYVHRQLGLPIASTAPMAKITDRFTTAVHRFAEAEHIEWVDFLRGERKDVCVGQTAGVVHGTGRGRVHRPGPRENPVVPDRETPSRRRGLLPVDRENHRGGQPLLLLLR